MWNNLLPVGHGQLVLELDASCECGRYEKVSRRTGLGSWAATWMVAYLHVVAPKRQMEAGSVVGEIAGRVCGRC